MVNVKVNWESMCLPKTGYTVTKDGLDLDASHNNSVLLKYCNNMSKHVIYNIMTKCMSEYWYIALCSEMPHMYSINMDLILNNSECTHNNYTQYNNNNNSSSMARNL